MHAACITTWVSIACDCAGSKAFEGACFAAGATTYRTNAVAGMLQCKPSVVRGNASEVMTAAGASSTIKGAESTAEVSESVEVAKAMAQRLGCVVAVSGKEDYVRARCADPVALLQACTQQTLVHAVVIAVHAAAHQLSRCRQAAPFAALLQRKVCFRLQPQKHIKSHSKQLAR